MSIHIPIQPFDDSFRTRICVAIAHAFDDASTREGGIDFDPDTCGEAADRVIAVLAEQLLGVSVRVAPQRTIGTGTLIIDTSQQETP